MDHGDFFLSNRSHFDLIRFFCRKRNDDIRKNKNITTKRYLRYKTITLQNVTSEVKIKNFFYFVEKLCFVLKIFKFLYF